MVSRVHTFGVYAEIKYRNYFPSDPTNGQSLPGRRDVIGCETHGTPENKKLALEAILKANVPASDDKIKRWLVRLHIVTASRKHDQVHYDLTLEMYTEQLRKFPADIVKHVLVDADYKFFPALIDLTDACQRKLMPRRQLHQSLERGEVTEKPRGPRCSSEEADRIMRESGFDPDTFRGKYKAPDARDNG